MHTTYLFVLMIPPFGESSLPTLTKVTGCHYHQVDHIMSEKQILAKLQHPFIVNMFGAPSGFFGGLC